MKRKQTSRATIRRVTKLWFSLVLAALAGGYAAQAQTNYTASLNFVFSGGTPAGSAPWINAAFSTVSPGTISLTISGPGLASPNFMSQLYLNVDPSLNVNDLNFTETTQVGTFTAPTEGGATLLLGEDAFQANTIGGLHDILLNFSTTSGQQFTTGDSITYSITGDPSLTALSFNATSSEVNPGDLALTAAALIQGSPADDWIGASNVPEPGIGSLLALGGLGLLARVRTMMARRY